MAIETYGQVGITDPTYHWVDQIEAVAAAPGVDPLIAMAEGREDRIPNSGYLVDARVAPAGERAGVRIYKYGEDGLTFSNVRDSRDDDDGGVIASTYFSSGYIETSVIYTQFPPYSTEYHRAGSHEVHIARSHATPLSGGRLIATTEPYPPSMGGLSTRLRSYDPAKHRNLDIGTAPAIDLVRAVGSVDEVIRIARAIGAGLELDSRDLPLFVGCVAEQAGKLEREWHKAHYAPAEATGSKAWAGLRFIADLIMRRPS